MTKERKLDLFGALNKLSIKQRMYYDNLSEDEQKEFLPMVLMRWLSGTHDAKQVYFLNEIINRFVFSLYKHKPLLAQLLIVSTSGKSHRYNWIKNSSKKNNTPLVIDVIEQYYTYTTKQATEILVLLNSDDIICYAEQLGKQPTEISKIKKELKLLYG